MARLNYIDYFKRALLEFATENDPLYAMLQWMTEKIMQLEAEQKVGAQKGEHSTERATHFSGNRLRRFDTRMGTMYLLVPKLRKGGYIPLPSVRLYDPGSSLFVTHLFRSLLSYRIATYLSSSNSSASCKRGGIQVPPERSL